MAADHLAVDDGARLWFDVEGTGVPLVLCHGGPGHWDNLSSLATLITGAARVIRWEQRGSGRSDRRGPYTVDRFVTDLDQLREHLGYERWIVGGHSWGATLALCYALAAPARVTGVVYISGVGVGRAWNTDYHEEADRRLTVKQRARREELRITSRDEEQEREYRALCWAPDFADRDRALDLASREAAVPFVTNYECNTALNEATKRWDEEEMLERCRTMGMPTLIVHGACDPRPSWAVEPLSTALRHCQLRVLPEAGHRPWIEKPEATKRVLTAFLRATAHAL